MKHTHEKLEESKKETLTKLSNIVNEYYDKYEESGKNRELTINHIEQFLIDCKDDVNKVLKEASADILRELEGEMIEKKKSVPTVRGN